MIVLRNLNQEEFLLNCDLIETIEFIPETKISLISGKYFLVSDSADEIVDKMTAYYSRIYGSEKTVHFVKQESREAE